MASINTKNDIPLTLARRARWSRDADEKQSAPLTVTFVDSVAAIPAELGASGFPRPLEGDWLYSVLEQSGLKDQFTFLYAVVHERASPVAAAPLFVMDLPMERVCPEKLLKTLRTIARVLPSVLFQRTLFVGSPGAAQGAIGVLQLSRGSPRPAKRFRKKGQRSQGGTDHLERYTCKSLGGF